jgi:hypothetical protein
MLLLAMPFVYQITRELSYRYNAPILVPAGIPVDLDAAARRQHDVATRSDLPEIKPLVQILPATAISNVPDRFGFPRAPDTPSNTHSEDAMDARSAAGESPTS